MAADKDFVRDLFVDQPEFHLTGTETGVAGYVDPTEEESYWRASYLREPYYLTGYPFDDYAPAYELGWSSRVRFDSDFNIIEPILAQDWETRRESKLTWAQARAATQAAWDRADQAMRSEQTGGEAMAEVLNDLLEICRDGEYGFAACAEHTQGEGLKSLFLERAKECRDAAEELQEHIFRLGGDPKPGGTTVGALHRGWVAVRGTLMGYTDQAMLDECEKGEDAAVEHYRKALEQPLSYTVRAVVERQMEGAQHNHGQIRALRDLHNR